MFIILKTDNFQNFNIGFSFKNDLHISTAGNDQNKVLLGMKKVQYLPHFSLDKGFRAMGWVLIVVHNYQLLHNI